jgi:hypothetical protein
MIVWPPALYPASALLVTMLSTVIEPANAGEMNSAQADYVEYCGGCHGIQGSSAPAKVPELRGRVGYFLCTPKTRRYLLRLPNVAYSSTDNEQLAELMNFVVFGLGGDSAQANRRHFTAEEVAAERSHPLSTVSLVAARARAVDDVANRCGVSKTRMVFSSAPDKPGSREASEEASARSSQERKRSEEVPEIKGGKSRRVRE